MTAAVLRGFRLLSGRAAVAIRRDPALKFRVKIPFGRGRNGADDE